MRKLVDEFLSPADRQAIVEAVAAAEKRTAAEIVPMVVGSSDAYPKAELACSVAIGLTAGVLLCLAFGTRNMWWFLLFFGIFALIAFEAVKRLPGIKRPFVSRERALAETKQAAQAAFFSHGLTETKARSAVLVYVSVFEHLVFIQPDTGITGKIAARDLDAATAALTAGIARGEQAAALVACVGTLADLLAPHLPPATDDVDELKNLILI